jgi:hypothetical protein
MLINFERVTDRLIRFDCEGTSIYVHRQLLCDRPDEMKEYIEDCEEVIDPSLSKIDHESWERRWYSKRGWELYIGSVYGHPIWTRSEQHSIEDDFEQLALIYEEGKLGTDPESSDATIDAIRDLVMHGSEALSRPFKILAGWGILDEGDTPQDVLMDFMVYGKSISVFGKWYHTFDWNFKLTSRLAATLTEKGKASYESTTNLTLWSAAGTTAITETITTWTSENSRSPICRFTRAADLLSWDGR